MGTSARARKLRADDDEVRYVIEGADAEGGELVLVLDKNRQTISEANGNENGVFRAVAGKLVRRYLETGSAPDTVVLAS